LAANALCWVGYFVFHFPPPSLYEYEIAERALYPLVWLVPLANLLAFFALDRGRHLIAGINTTGVYALLPSPPSTSASTSAVTRSTIQSF
jgi:hypothetical protein